MPICTFNTRTVNFRISRDTTHDRVINGDDGFGFVMAQPVQIMAIAVRSDGSTIGFPAVLFDGLLSDVRVTLDLTLATPSTEKYFLVMQGDMFSEMDITLTLEGQIQDVFRWGTTDHTVIIGILERRGKNLWGFGSPGITINHPIKFWLSSAPAKELMKDWGCELPNARIEYEQLPAEHWGHLLSYCPTVRIQGLYSRMAASRSALNDPTHLLRALMRNWEDSMLDAQRSAVVLDLLASGASWGKIMVPKALGLIEGELDWLLSVAKSFPNWSRLILNHVDTDTLLSYASTQEKADAVYKIRPQPWLLDRLSERGVANVLEDDLGL